MTVHIGIAGCAGRMGRMLAAAVLETPAARLVGGSERPGHEAVGADLGTLAGSRTRRASWSPTMPSAMFAAADVVIDFTTPALIAEHVRLAVEPRDGARRSAPPGSKPDARGGAGRGRRRRWRWFRRPT